MSTFHPLKVAKITRETSKAVSIAFSVPDELRTTFQYKAGQYITLKTLLDGEEVRRAYSICEAPASAILKVAVKEVADGTFSKYANQELKEGDVLEVMPPEGRFVYVSSTQKKDIAAFAAGSGITPIMSVLKTVLAEEESSFTLVYGNQTKEQTIFYEELLALQSAYPDRFNLYFIFSRESQEDALYGRIERATVNFVVKNKQKHLDFDAFYLCGPKPMIDVVSETLQEHGVDEEKILFELFTEAEAGQPLEANLDGQTEVHVLVDDEEFSFTMAKEQTILEAALKQDIDAPYSCQGGICSSCIARLTEGTAVMEKNQILTDGELAEGLILTCQAHPTSATIKVDYDDV